MRILVLSCYPPNGSGGELQTQLQALELARRGHDVTVIDLRPRQHGRPFEIEGGVTIIRIRTSTIPVLRSALYHGKLAWHVVRRGSCAEVAHINNIGTALIGAVPLLRLLGIPMVLVIWGSAMPGVGPFGSGLRNSLSRSVARHCQRIVSLARSSMPHLVAHGFEKGRIVWIPNGIDTERFQPRMQGETPQAPGVGPKFRPAVITVGRLVPEKALDVLLKAWSIVASRHATAGLVIVGDGPLRERLRSLSAELGVDTRVCFLGSRSDVPALLRSADVYVSSSRTEGMSNSILEALASGLPVVATKVGAAEDSVDDGSTGFVVPPGDADALARALLRLLDDLDLQRRMSTKARARILADFHIGSIVERYLTLYGQVFDT